MNIALLFSTGGAWIRTFPPKGASIRNFPCQYTLSHVWSFGQKGTLTKRPHDRTRPRSGGAHFAGVPSKLCIYDNFTLVRPSPHKYGSLSCAPWLFPQEIWRLVRERGLVIAPFRHLRSLVHTPFGQGETNTQLSHAPFDHFPSP